MSIPAHIPRVKALTPAGPESVSLTLEDGQTVTVTACPGTALGPDGVLLTDYLSGEGVVYVLPPDLSWEACARLGLYPVGTDRERLSELDTYLLTLPTVTDAAVSDGLILAFTLPGGWQDVQVFPASVQARITMHEPGEPFARFPLTLTVEQGRGEELKLYVFRVDHTEAGYAVLDALGWGNRLPSLEDVRAVPLTEAAD